MKFDKFSRLINIILDSVVGYVFNNSPYMIKKFGNFYINIKTKSLFHLNQEVKIEPQVLNVLIYLISNNERHIDLSELHRILWRNKVVSDSAIRRTICRLRHILGDKKLNPSFVKSATHKGYRFIHPIEDLGHQDINLTCVKNSTQQPNTAPKNTPNTDPNNTPNNTPNNAPNNAPNNDQKKSTVLSISVHQSNQLTIVLLTCLLFILSLPITVPLHNLDLPTTISHHSPLVQLRIKEPVFEFFGKGMFPDSHTKRPLTIFAYKKQHSETYELFLLNTITKKSRQLTNDTFNYYQPTWISDNRLVTLAVNQYTCQILSLKLTNDSNPPQFTPLTQCQSGHPNLNFNSQTNHIFFSDRKNWSTPLNLLKMDLSTQKTSPYSTATSDDDYLSAISTNNSKLAYARNHKKQYTVLYIEDLYNGKIIKRLNTEGKISSLFWLNEHELIYHYLGQLGLYNITTNLHIQTIISPDIRFLFPNKAQPEQPFVIKVPPQIFLLEQTSNPFSESPIHHQTVDFADNPFSAIYDDNDRIFYLSKDEQHQIYLISEDLKFLLPVNDHITKLKIQGISLNKQLLLLSNGSQIILYSWKTQQITYITKESDRVANASLTQDKTAIVYAIQRNSEWTIQKYHIDQQRIESFIPNGTAIQPYKHGYVVRMSDHHLALFSMSGALQQSLNTRLLFTNNTDWIVRNDYIYYYTQHQETINLHRYHIKTGITQNQPLDSGTYSGDFSLSKQGDKLIRIIKQHDQSTIYLGELIIRRQGQSFIGLNKLL